MYALILKSSPRHHHSSLFPLKINKLAITCRDFCRNLKKSLLINTKHGGYNHAY